MPKKVVCTLPNASELINGVRFEHMLDGSVVSEEVSDEVAAQFLGIRGYALIDVEPQAKGGKASAKTQLQLGKDEK